MFQVLIVLCWPIRTLYEIFPDVLKVLASSNKHEKVIPIFCILITLFSAESKFRISLKLFDPIFFIDPNGLSLFFYSFDSFALFLSDQGRLKSSLV